jgi:hypothetical protein
VLKQKLPKPSAADVPILVHRTNHGMTMKKEILSTLVSLSFFSTALFAAPGELSFSEQMQIQKQQLRPHVFNFFSDRYQQMQAHDSGVKLTFKAQLDSQKSLLRTQEFNPVSDAYKQVTAHKS